jgi:uncharacterized membrane protein YfcA
MSIPPFPPELVAPAILCAAAAFVAGLARGFSGFGAAMIFVPVVSSALGPVVAMPILLIADILTASPIIVRAARECSWPDVRKVAIGGLIGLPIGNHILTGTDPIIVRWLVTALIAASLAAMLSGWRFRVSQTTAAAGGVGLVSGLMSGLAQIGGPPVVMYWLGTGLHHARIRANLIIYFAFLMWLAMAIFLAKGLVPGKVLWLGAAAAPSYAAGVYLGTAVFPLASPETFRRIAMGLIALATVTGMPILDPLLRRFAG